MRVFLFLLFCLRLNAAILYVRSTDGNDADNGSTWALAKATLAGAFSAAAAGDTIYVSQVHAETQTGAMTLTSPGTAASPCKVLCGNDGAEPPTALATTGTISTTSTGNMTIAGFAYCYGIIFTCGTSGNRVLAVGTSIAWGWRMEACALKLGAGVSSSGTIQIGLNASGADDQLLEMVNTTVGFTSTGQGINIFCPFYWSNTASAVTGTVPTSLFLTAAGNGGVACITGVDLSALTSGKNLVNVAGGQFTKFYFNDCKLGASVAMTTGSVAGFGGATVQVVNADSSSTNYRYHLQDYTGTITQETTIVRTSGATDGTTPISRKMVTTANSSLMRALVSQPILYWNETTGSSQTVTIPIITDNVTLTDAEAWVEVQYLGTSGTPLGNFVSDRAADILATPANQTTDTSTWTTTGLTTPLKQQLSVSFTAQLKGVVSVRIYLAKASTTMYFDPLAITGARQFQTSGGFQNQPSGGTTEHSATFIE